MKPHHSKRYINAINRHYGHEGLGQISIATGNNALNDPVDIEVEKMLAFDQLHIGGRQASLYLARKAGLSASERILDAGCGLGGSSRLLAKYFGSQVFGADLTARFCHLAHRLSCAAKLGNRTFFLRADLNTLPVHDNAFDVIWAQHILMNIKDKSELLKEFARILKPSGRLLLHEVVQGDRHPVYFPVPWAGDASLSFLCSAVALETDLRGACFHTGELRDESESALAWFDKRKTLTAQTPAAPKPAVGNADRRTAAIIRSNVWRNLKEKRIRVVQGIFTVS